MTPPLVARNAVTTLNVPMLLPVHDAGAPSPEHKDARAAANAERDREKKFRV